MNKATKISLQRLTCTGISLEDAEDIVCWRSNKQLIKYFRDPQPLTMEKHMVWFQNYLENPDRYDFIIHCKADNAKIGVLSLSGIWDEKGAEIGYMIASQTHQRQGFAKESIAGLIEFAQREFGIRKFCTEIHSENFPSIQTVLRLGFIKTEKADGMFECYTCELK
ncbi:MAG: GNAT family N-acetyltransferase [Pygmaiobacter sp.]